MAWLLLDIVCKYFKIRYAKGQEIEIICYYLLQRKHYCAYLFTILHYTFMEGKTVCKAFMLDRSEVNT